MICREVSLTPDLSHWLLISQVEHARLSAELARHWIATSAAEVLVDTKVAGQLRSDVLAAIEHHDDGWARWELSPQIDPKLGRPLTYRGEVALDETLRIWGDSIASAYQFGPLAGFMVARHFMCLLNGSEQRSDVAARSWLRATEQSCGHRLDEWKSISSLYTSEVAERAVAHLQLYDRLSLWLCCDCPIGLEMKVGGSEPFVLQSHNVALGPFRFTPLTTVKATMNFGSYTSLGKSPVSVEPWPFGADIVGLEVTGVLVPKLAFHEPWHEVVAAGRHTTIGWEFVPR